MPERILIVEDEEHIARGVKLNLEAEGYRVEVVDDGREAIAHIRRAEPDLVILDVNLPGVDGFTVCETVRGEGRRVPILFLTVRDSEDDRVRGLELGGDDYLAKPFSIRELLQRVKAILRREEWYRQDPATGSVLQFGPNRVDFSAYRAWTPQGEIALTQKECMLLKLLAENEGRVVDRNTILDQVWGYDRYPSTRTIDNLILRLRKTFEADPKRPRHIHSLYGAGYKFTREETEG
ncbi:MAG: DNA-binding response regulator [Candidatus Zixiibacteriota bacterium]|nr:MAG: DNA-binding response regulator [candidate division Zixibacteria bacterium]